MAIILEQDNIDKLVQLQIALDAKKEVALTAKQKVNEMFIDVLGYPNFENMDTIDSIGKVISDIAIGITYDSKYLPSFSMLKQSYEEQIKQRSNNESNNNSTKR